MIFSTTALLIVLSLVSAAGRRGSRPGAAWIHGRSASGPERLLGRALEVGARRAAAAAAVRVSSGPPAER